MAQVIIDPTLAQQNQDHPLDSTTVVRHLTHELRQPLSTIESSAYYLKLILEDQNHGAVRQLDRIEQMVHQISWILSDAVHYLQAAAPRRQLLDLTEIATAVIASYPQEHQMRLHWHDGDAAPLVAMDPNQAQHMVRSVLQVFRQVCHGQAPVALNLRATNGCALLTFTGEAPDSVLQQCAELLNPFDAHLPAGTGLGLASAKRIAEAHGGHVRIYSDATSLVLEVLFPAAS